MARNFVLQGIEPSRSNILAISSVLLLLIISMSFAYANTGVTVQPSDAASDIMDLKTNAGAIVTYVDSTGKIFNLKLGTIGDANGFRIINLASPTSATDAARMNTIGNKALSPFSNPADQQVLTWKGSNSTAIWQTIPATTPIVTNQSSTYLVYPSSGTYYAKNQKTGVIDFSGTDAQTIIEDATNATLSSGGGTITLKDGTYNLVKAVRIGNNINIQGESWKTILHLNNNALDSVITNEITRPAISPIIYLGHYNMTVSNLQIDGNYLNQGVLYPTVNYIGIKLEQCDTCTVTNVYVHDINGMAISVSSLEPYEHQAVLNSYIKHAVGDAIFFQAQKGIAANNRIEMVGDNGIVVARGQGVVVSNNAIFGDPHGGTFGMLVGIGTYRSTNNTVVTGNTIVNSVKDGINISAFGTPDTYGCDSCIFTGNTIKNVTRYGFYFGSVSHDNNTRITISGNNILGSHQYGILSQHSQNLIISNNIISNNFRSGISIFGSYVNNTLISNNIISNNGQDGSLGFDGINCGGGANHGNNTMITSNYVYDDQITKTQRYGIRNDCGGSYNGYVSNNNVYGNALGQISAFQTSLVTGNFQNGVLDPIIVSGTITGVVTFTGNPVTINHLKLGGAMNQSNQEIDSLGYKLFEGSNIYRIQRTTANSSTTLFVIPSGTATRSVISLYGNSSTNSDSLSIVSDGNLGHEITVGAGGTGKLDNLRIKMGSTTEILFNTDNSINFLSNKISNPNIIDNGFKIIDDVDNTKIMALQLSGLSTAHTQTYTAPNKNGTWALTSDLINTAQIGDAGHGASIFSSRPNATQNLLKTIYNGTNMKIISNSTNWTFNSATWQNNTGSNLGTANGLGLYTSNSGSILQFRSITCGSNLSCSTNSTNLRINATGSTGIATINNDATSAQVLQGQTGNITANTVAGTTTFTLGTNVAVLGNNQQIFTKKITTTPTSSTSGFNLGTLATYPTSPRKGDIVINGTKLSYNDNNNATQTVANIGFHNIFTVKQSFMPPNSTDAGVNFGTTAGTPSNLISGDCWINTLNWLNCRIGSATKAFGTTSSGNTWSGTQTIPSGGTITFGTLGVLKIGSSNFITRNPAATFATSEANSAITQNTTATKPLINSNWTYQAEFNTNQTNGGNNTGITTPIYLGTPSMITTMDQGKIFIDAGKNGWASPTTTSTGCILTVYYGLSSSIGAPANGTSTIVGTKAFPSQQLDTSVAGDELAINVGGWVSGLNTNSKYWVTLLGANQNGITGSCSILRPSMTLSGY